MREESSDGDGFSRSRHSVLSVALVLAAVAAVLAAVAATSATSVDAGSAEPIVLAAASPGSAPGTRLPASPAASPEPQPPDVSQPAGRAVAMSRRLFPTGDAAHVILTRDAPSGDAFAAGALIGLYNTTILLTGPDELTPITAEEITRLGRPHVHILGGGRAVSEDIEQRLADAGHVVHRHAGPTQADTAANIAQSHFPNARTAVLGVTPHTDAQGGPGVALAASALAAARRAPLLFTDGTGLSAQTREYITEAPIRQVVLVSGQENGIGAGVTEALSELGIGWFRWGGASPSETAVAIARNRGFLDLGDADVVVLAGDDIEAAWPDGLLQAVVLARNAGPVLLTSGDELPEPTAQYLATSRPGRVEVICLPGVADDVCQRAVQTASGQ